MTEFLKNLIARNQKKFDEITSRMRALTDANEVRKLGETLLALRDEINDAEKQLAELEKPAEPEKPAEEETARNAALASYGMKPANPNASRSENVRETMEYREAFMNYAVKGMRSNILQFKKSESRADDQTESGDLGVLLPLTIVQEIIKGVEKVYGQLYSRVRKTNVKGGVKYPIGSFSGTFHRIGENGAPTDRQNGGSVSGYVEFTYKLGEIRFARTLLESVVSVPVFEQNLTDEIVKAYVKAMDTEIMTGDGTDNELEGIITEANKQTSRIPAGNIVEFTATDMADWKKWQEKLFAIIPLSMRGLKPEFVMTANTYESNIKTLTDDNNRPLANEVFNVVDGTDKATFKGKEVVFVENDAGIEDFNSASNGDYFGMYWVPNNAYGINTNLEFAVQRYFDNEKMQYVDRAVVINDGKILDPTYIYLLKKSVQA